MAGKGKDGRRLVLLIAGAAVLLGAAGILLFRGRVPKAFDGNLLLITLDTTRADSLGAYGGSDLRTPVLDRLAREGVMFRNCVSPVPLTLPAHASLFTGRTPLAHQVRNNGRYALAPEELTLAERLKTAGSRTYAVIASYVLLGRFGLKQGFDEYDDSLDSYKLLNSYNTEITADVVSGRFWTWLLEHREERFFAWVHFYDPHEPYAPPAPYRKPPNAKDPKGLYLGEVEFMDHHIGKIVEALEALGLLSNTLLVVVGDHGEAFGEHGEKGHTIFCYEENIRVPLIFFHETRLPKGRVVEDQVGLIDILPTLLELHGLERGEEIQGRSLVPYFRNGAGNPPPPLYLESFYGFEEMGWAPLTGMIDGDLKYISLPRPELYDLRSDPGEKDNLHDQRPDLARRMKDGLASYVSSHTEIRGETTRGLTTDDLHRLRSLGYVSSSSKPSPNNVDPKDGIVLNAGLSDFFRSLENIPPRDIDPEIERFLRKRNIERSPAFYARLWRMYEKRKDRDKVVETLREAITAFPGDIGFQMHLIQAHSVMTEWEAVVAHGRRILEQDAANSVAHILMANAYTAMQDWDRAEFSLEKALEIEPGNVSLLITYAETLLARRKIQEALNMYEGLITRPDVLADHDFLYKVSLFFAQNGHDRRAAELMARCSRLKPSGKSFFYLAVFLDRLGEQDAAKENMKTAFERYTDELTFEQRAAASSFLQLR